MSEYSSVNEKWLALVARLIFNTKSKELSWASGPSDNCVVTSIGDYVISVFEHAGDRENEIVFVVEISDDLGSTIDKFSDDDLSGWIDNLSPFSALSTLFRDAKRNISGADKALDKLLAALPPPKEKARAKGIGSSADLADEIPF